VAYSLVFSAAPLQKFKELNTMGILRLSMIIEPCNVSLLIICMWIRGSKSFL